MIMVYLIFLLFVCLHILTYTPIPHLQQDNDIALVFLGQNAVFNERVRPICLAQNADYVPGASTIVTGWGVEVFCMALYFQSKI